MTLRISASCLAAVWIHARAAYPDEGCGLLLGPEGAPEGADRLAIALHRIDNRWEEGERRRRFKIAPEDFLAAEESASARGLEIVGVYHSHPDHPPAPSDYDLAQAWPFYSYLIVEVEAGRAGRSSCWRLAPDRSAFREEPLLADPDPPLAAPEAALEGAVRKEGL
jgi:proteasome lid subunit RPN8/RPN11